MLIIDFITMRLETVKKPKIKKGMLKRTNNTEILISTWVFTRSAIPVTPPSKNPLGNKNALSPILANIIPSII